MFKTAMIPFLPTAQSASRRFIHSLCFVIGLTLVMTIFVISIYADYSFREQVATLDQNERLVQQHLQEVEQLRGSAASVVFHQDEASFASFRQHAQTALSGAQWLEFIAILKHPGITNTFPYSIVHPFSRPPSINTTALKVLQSEIILSLDDTLKLIANKQLEETQITGQKTFTILSQYLADATQASQQRHVFLDNVKTGYQRAISLGFISPIVCFILTIIGLIGYNRNRSKTQKALADAQVTWQKCLQQLRFGMILVNDNLEAETSELAPLNLDNHDIELGPTPIDSLFFNLMPEDELRNFKQALQALFDDQTEARISLKIPLTSAEGISITTLTGELLKLSKKRKKVLLVWQRPEQDLVQATEPPPTAPLNVQSEKAIETRHIKLKKDFNRRLKLIEVLTKMNPSIGGEFFQDTKKILRTCQMRITSLQRGQHDPSTMISGLMQSLHQIKGDSAILGLTELSQSLHKLEDSLMQLPHPPLADQAKVDKIAEQFEQIKRQFEGMGRLFLRFTNQEHVIEQEEKQNIANYLNQFAQKIARDCDKKVKFIDHQLENLTLPDKTLSQVMTLLSQLIRNAVVHGVETPAVRRELKKTEYGCVHVALYLGQSEIEVAVRDDGKGIDIPQIIAQVKTLKGDSLDLSQRITGETLFDLLATPGLTTQIDTTEHAGRGVGLDLVKNVVQQLNGNIKLDTKPGQFTQFSITLPLPEKRVNDDIPTLTHETEVNELA